MPPFFVPHADDAAQAERVWQATKVFMESQGYGVLDTRIERVSYTHNGQHAQDVVGQPNRFTGETVLVILDADGLYLSCSENFGVVRGGPFMIGKHWDTHGHPFED